MKCRLLFTRVAASLAISGLASAHHSGAMLDGTRTQTLVGSDGKHVICAVEMNMPQNLVREGWKRTTIKAGDKVKAVVHPLRDGKPGGSYVAVKLADGKVLSVAGLPNALRN